MVVGTWTVRYYRPTTVRHSICPMVARDLWGPSIVNVLWSTIVPKVRALLLIGRCSEPGPSSWAFSTRSRASRSDIVRFLRVRTL